MNQSTSIAANEAPPRPSAGRPGYFERLLVSSLSAMKVGRLEMQRPGQGSLIFGGKSTGPQAFMSINDERFFKRCVLYGAVGLGETYMDGDWDTPNIRPVIEWFIHNIRAQDGQQNSPQRRIGVGALALINRIGHILRPNSLKTSRRNISEHYDLGNDFYKLWLDPSMTYSAAKFTEPHQTLEAAQVAKYDALCQKLRVKSTDRVLEIGCGWGGFSMYAARNYGCHVTGITISQEQYDEARARVSAAGLEDKVSILMVDYRKVTGEFDKIASIEMLEAVGDKYVETYFRKCSDLLTEQGMLAFQVITVPDDKYLELRNGVDWIQKHIFPGSLLLSTARINQAINRTGNLYMHSFEDLGAGYSRTLREWWKTFNSKLDEVRALGFDERFIRKWNFYLRYCEAGFAARNISVVQACYTKPGNLTLHSEDGIS